MLRGSVGRKLAQAAAAAAYGAWVRSYQVDPRGDEVHFARTDDGWRIALSRYRAAGGRSRRHPVVLCHGLAASRVGFDLPRRSLARHLAGQGWDVWCLELRGHGLSDMPDLFSARRWGWSFDDYLHRDLPVALERVLSETGREAVHWVGHSMGGLLLYSHLATATEPRIRSGIAVGSSLDYSQAESDFKGLIRWLGLAKALPAIPFGPLAAVTSPLSGRVPNRLEEFNLWPANVEPRLQRQLNASSFHPVSSAVLIQLATAFEPGGLRSADGKVRYLEGLPRSRVPVLAVAGDKDRQCSPDAARVPVDALGSEDKGVAVFGKGEGHAEHYGHFDLIIGQRAPVETWPLLEGWLADRD